MDYSDSESEEYEQLSTRSSKCGLPFDPSSIEKIILLLSDQFDFRVVLNDSRIKGAMLITTGLTVAGGLIGRHYGGKVGGVVGGAIGGACGLGIVAVSMRDMWSDIKNKLSELFDIVYDYLAGMGIEDYKKAAIFLTHGGGSTTQLAMVVAETAAIILGKKILSNISGV